MNESSLAVLKADYRLYRLGKCTCSIGRKCNGVSSVVYTKIIMERNEKKSEMKSKLFVLV